MPNVSFAKNMVVGYKIELDPRSSNGQAVALGEKTVFQGNLNQEDDEKIHTNANLFNLQGVGRQKLYKRRNLLSLPELRYGNEIPACRRAVAFRRQ